MELKDLKQIPDDKLEQISAGAAGVATVAILSAIPAIVNSIAPIVGIIKSSLSANGEIKTKEATYKWDDTKTADSIAKNYVLF
ncbi:hypothetical protein [Mycoplasma sp. Ms02]|uniref:hypothetical protein n=1 Tax=Mycoplasma sp. Ms02 TaxID=353851 RepID=UPI001C893734|nr:hypothetical protein [Mycoplasma sp. Ms02]QZE12570.1 hypothetical protein K4L35_01105 [Mycoplasma sp. Ms02]